MKPDIGLALPHVGTTASPAAIAKVASGMEEMGCRTAWVLERLLRPVNTKTMPPSYSNVYDPIETLTWVAAKTERIRLGTSIIDALFHVPVVLARRFATLDQLSGGRVVAGLGQGEHLDEFRTANVPIGRRGAGFEEFIHAMKTAWGPDPVAFEGRFYHIAESQIGPKPVQQPHPPIILAAQATSLASVERAGRIADGFNPVNASWEKLEPAIKRFREAAVTAGRDPSKLELIVRGNSTVVPQKVEGTRPPLYGDREQVLGDLRRIADLGADEVFFDMNYFNLEAETQLAILRDLRASFS
jgi:probable F420-dependent oxidoreductase